MAELAIPLVALGGLYLVSNDKYETYENYKENYENMSNNHLVTKPADINYPVNKSDKSSYRFQTLEQKEIQVPVGIKIKSEYGFYSAEYSSNSSLLTIEEKFILFAKKIPLEKYCDFHEFIDSINSYKKKTAVIIK